MEYYGIRDNTKRAYESLRKNWITGKIDGSKESLKVTIEAMKDLSNSTKSTVLYLIKSEYPELEPYVKKYHKNLNKKMSPNIEALTMDQARKLKEYCRNFDKEFYPILLLAMHAGLRRGEIFGLSWQDIDFNKNTIHIKRSYDGPTKNGQSRIVPMTEELTLALEKRHNRVDPRIFKVLDPNPRLRGLCVKAGVPPINFHKLRHTFCTILLEGGQSPKTVQMLAGHKRLSTTLDIYWNYRNEIPKLCDLP